MLRAVVKRSGPWAEASCWRGVETPEQYALACTLRADRLQGYYLARPMPGEELCALMQRRAAHAQNLKRLWLQPLNEKRPAA